MSPRIHLQGIMLRGTLEWLYPVPEAGFFPNAASRHRI